MLIVYSFEDAQSCYAMNPNIMLEVMIPSCAQFAKFEKYDKDQLDRSGRSRPVGPVSSA